MNKTKFFLVLSIATLFFIKSPSHLQAATNLSSSNEKEQVKLTNEEVAQLKTVLEDPTIKASIPEKLYTRFTKEIWFGAGVISTITLALIVGTIKKTLKKEVETKLFDEKATPTETPVSRHQETEEQAAPALVPGEHQYAARDHLCWDGTDGIHAPGAMVRGSRIATTETLAPAASAPKTLRNGKRY